MAEGPFDEFSDVSGGSRVRRGRKRADALPTSAPIRPHLSDLRSWRDAQAALSPALAAASLAFGALDERLRGADQWQRLHLALLEATAISRHVGDRVALHRVTLCHGEGSASQGDAVDRAVQAVNRLMRPAGEDLADRIACDCRSGPRGTAPLHHMVTAAWGFACRQAYWEIDRTDPASGDEKAARQDRLADAVVTAARIGARAGRGGALFLPLTLGGGQGLRAHDNAEAALTDWVETVEAGALVALAQLDRLAAWRSRAIAATGALSGRVPGRLIGALAARPVVSAALAEAASGASRAAVQRNLDRLVDLGLIREITGRGRYRLWTAVL